MAIECAAKVKGVIRRTPQTKSVRLEPEEWHDFKAGQFLYFSVRPEKEFSRYLSISNSPTETGYIEVTKKITGSAFSAAFDSLKPGDAVKLLYPMGSFTFNGEYGRIAFLSGGVGITPIRSICRYIIDKGLGTDVALLYANRSPEDIAFRDDFDAMRRDGGKFKIVHVLCGPGEIECSRAGLINPDLIKEEIPDYGRRRFYVCGPPAMVESMKRILAEDMKVASADIVTENFIGY